ncbi:MAG TPA: TetR/AcrR family transcriptional regulator [Candidatus Binatus sp.]|uniref:TetR/AcrR family transcriptional regulator n=1 Tax=Candidatus Binatus sp. TaxID=2811406 RepID=UPI002F3E7758
MSVKRLPVSPPIRRKDGRGRPSTPFLRERILQSAAELFADREFDLVLIDEVAAHAGVGKGSVYRQFKSKEELYAAAVIDGFAELQREIRTALAGCTSMREQIATIVRHTVRFFWTRRQFFALLRDPKALPPSQERQYRAQRNDLSRLISGVLDEAVRRGAMRPGFDTRIAAEALLGMVRGINRYGREYTTPDHAADIVTSIFLDGCGAR